MRRASLVVLCLVLASAPAMGREARLVRYPHYHNGKVVFSYLGDIWVAGEDGKNIQRLTAHKARDAYPRFSPDGKWIAFSSDRNGNLDVCLIPAEGGQVKAITTHSADDTALAWSPDSKQVLFMSQRGEGFMPKLYVAPIDGGIARDAGPDMGVSGSFSPDGHRLVLNRKAQLYWRKGYHGAYQSDVTVMDLTSKTFKDLTDYNGMDSWPMWSSDGFVYFVSDRDGSMVTNIWRVPENGGAAERVTAFSSGDVRFPAISADGKTIVFEHEFGLWKLDIPSKQVNKITLEINAETQENLTDYVEYNSQVDDYALAPSGRRIAFAIHGEVFTAPVEEGDLVQLTDSPWRDRNVEYSPDGKTVAYVSDQSGREEIWLVPADGGEARKLTDNDSLKSNYVWSPDSKLLLYTTPDGKLYRIGADGKDQKELLASKFGSISGVTWSPDGKWIAYSRPDVSRSSDVYLLPADGGEEKKVTFDSSSEMSPKFAADGRTLYFIRAETNFESLGQGERPTSNIFAIPFEKQEKDPDDPESRPATPAGGGPAGGGNAVPGGPRAAAPPKEIKIDWAGLKRRTHQVTRMTSSIFNYTPARDGRTLVFVSVDNTGAAPVPTIYSIGHDGKRLTRITTGGAAAPTEGEGRPRGARGFFGGGISNLQVSRDGRSVFFLERDNVYSAPLSGGGGGLSSFLAAAAGGSAPMPGGGRGRGGAGGGSDSSPSEAGSGGKRRISFTARVKVDKPAEWLEMFQDAWRTMKYRFYDPKLHDTDWDAAKAKYEPLVAYVGDRHELMNIINEMIGELNASHTGASAGGGRARGDAAGAGGNVQTGHLGFDLEPDDSSGKYKVTYIYETGPADKDWIKLSVGDFLLAINGKPIKAGDNYWEVLNRRLNRKVTLKLNSKPEDDGAWTIKIDPISMAAFSNLRYDRWVKERRAMVDKQSNGRIGYLHIKAMDQPSLAKFKKELAEFHHKEALVIDQRFNGGGNIEQELLAILVQRPYQVWRPRGTEPTQRPFAGYYGPKVVLQNWRSASNAEMFPAGFRALGLGKVIGTPTMGAVIGTGSYSLMDGSTVRTPGVGVFLADPGKTNMENLGIQPDIYVENSPEDNLAGHDRQVERAVEELLKQLPAKDAQVAADGANGK